MSPRPSLRSTALVLAGITIVILAWLSTRNSSPTDAELVRVDEHPLYVMHYRGDYQFDEFLKEGIGPPGGTTQGQADTPAWSCTVFAALGWAGDALFGRNFDWSNDPALLLFTQPQGAFASVSVVDLAYLGFGQDQPDEAGLAALSRAPYFPFDGMNEKGLAVGMMSVPTASPGYDPERITLDSLSAMRLLLDYAATVEAAITLLGQYNIDFGGEPPLHYLVADRGGHSAVIEFLDGRMVVTRNEQPWQVATNFILSGRTPEQARSTCSRYRVADEALARTAGRIDLAGSMDLLQSVAQPSTVWSVVYDLNTGEIAIAMGRNYARVHRFSLTDELGPDFVDPDRRP